MNGLSSIDIYDLERIMDHLRAGIVIADAGGTVLWANQYYETITGIAIKHYIGKHVEDIQQNKDIVYLDAKEPLFNIAVREKRAVNNVLCYNTTDYIITTTEPILDSEGEIQFVIYTLTNYNDTVRAQQELAATYARIAGLKAQIQQTTPKLRLGDNIVVQNAQMQRLYEKAAKLANVSASVMLLGETGVGKDVMAKYIHFAGERSSGPFIHVNLGAIPKPLFESELFGYEPGSFTGASKYGKEGLVQMADKGTLFLDEVGELPLDIQAKLLQVVQDRAVRSVGGTQEEAVDIRIISATNQNLEAMVREGSFRMDLYYRLNVIDLHIPPLRQRQEDIPLLAVHFLKEFNENYHTHKVLAPETVNYLTSYDWPGNVRELRHTIERAVAINDDSLIRPEFLPSEILAQGSPVYGMKQQTSNEPVSLHAQLNACEINILRHALDCYPTLAGAARALGVSPSTLAKKRDRYGL